uniref:Phosphodiesterase 2A n=1 Tax=Cyprinus carpio TaxID=7962 RepID=A0A8C1JXX2_CYPCA
IIRILSKDHIFLLPQIPDFQIVVSQTNIVLLTNHTSMERLFIQLSDDVYISISQKLTLMPGFVLQAGCWFSKCINMMFCCVLRYMEADEHVIQHCFCYTSTVLTSTLAFQKEQKLKFECQVRRRENDVSVLLQEIIIEARNLSNSEQLFSTLIIIRNSLLYKKVHEAQFRSHLANEMMMYHMKVSEEEVTKLLHSGIEPVQKIHPDFSEFTYTPRSLTDDSTPMGVLSMFEDMGFINTYKLDLHTLARFCLMVKKGYRDPPYHNWMHAFSVSHFCYLLYKNLQLSNYLDADLVSGIAILNTQGCNIFEKFSRKDYQRMLDLMRDIILATDLAHHLRIFKDLQKMADAGYNPRSQTHRSLLLCLLMTSCDLSDQTKGWKTTRKIAELIYKEFFSQGDLEKAMGNRPSEMMDREKAYIPELQISFMEHIAMPIYKLLQEIFPRSAELYERVAANREQWAKVSHKFTIRGLPSNNSLDFLDEEFELLQSQGAFGDDSHRMNGCLDDDCDKHNQ